VNTLAVALLGLFALGYLVLGGADIGVGMVLPFLGRTSRDRRLVIAAIAPFFLGNEVWLVATAGVLAGAFPAVESSVLHGLYPAVAALLLGWVVRDMGLWLRGRVDARGWRACCDTAITLGSWTVALSWGAILASLIAGSTTHVRTTPGAIATALAVAGLFAVHGMAFAAVRLTGPLRDRARRLYGASGEAALLAVTSTAFVILGLLAGSGLEPADGTAPHASLVFLLPPLLIVAPLLLTAQGWVWWTFRHRVTTATYL
jgi:cytochrome d ubiquinol oxidase subunit II